MNVRLVIAPPAPPKPPVTVTAVDGGIVANIPFYEGIDSWSAPPWTVSAASSRSFGSGPS